MGGDGDRMEIGWGWVGMGGDGDRMEIGWGWVGMEIGMEIGEVGDGDGNEDGVGMGMGSGWGWSYLQETLMEVAVLFDFFGGCMEVGLSGGERSLELDGSLLKKRLKTAVCGGGRAEEGAARSVCGGARGGRRELLLAVPAPLACIALCATSFLRVARRDHVPNTARFFSCVARMCAVCAWRVHTLRSAHLPNAANGWNPLPLQPMTRRAHRSRVRRFSRSRSRARHRFSAFSDMSAAARRRTVARVERWRHFSTHTAFHRR